MALRAYFSIDAAPDRFDDVVEPVEGGAQLDDQAFFPLVIVVASRCGRVER